MTSTSHVSIRSHVIPSFSFAVAILAALTVIRLIGLEFSVVDLFFDEAQYWAWSREPAFGYFTKPPLLAWIIAGAETLCGSSEACIRAPAPILYFGTCLLVFAIARQLYDESVAFFAAIATALTPGLAFSATSTKVPPESRYTANKVSKPLPIVLMITCLLAGAVHRYQTECPPVSPA